MSTRNRTKLHQLLSSTPAGVVLTAAWLRAKGYSKELQKRYRRSGWLTSIGTGALIRTNDRVDYLGGIYALQSQLGLSLHPGAKTALSLHGKSHYLELSTKTVQLFVNNKENVPAWFIKYDWRVRPTIHKTTFLPPDLGLVSLKHNGFDVKVSSPARAIMECLYLSPKKQSLLEVYELMEGLNNLRPQPVQQLLEQCQSIKVKRLFLFLAERAGHQWLTYVNLDNVDLGSGKRVIEPDGVYVAKYQIYVPRGMESGNEQSL